MKLQTFSFATIFSCSFTSAFQHPGIIAGLSQMNNIKSKVNAGTQPWSGSWDVLKNDAMASASYVPSPDAEITTSSPIRADTASAYLNALNWYISVDTACLQNAIAIINAYVDTTTSVDTAAQISAFIGAWKLSAAVELVRANSQYWTSTYQSNFNSWFMEVMYPICNGGITGSLTGTPGDGNQGAGDLRCLVAGAIATDNSTLYDYAINLWKTNACFGIAYVDSNGCTGEAGRDMAHPQLALEILTDIAKMAEIQGDTSLWSYNNNRLATGWEWMAKRNLNNGSVPFTNTKTCYSSYSALSNTNLGKLIPTYQMPYTYYTSTGVSMPYTAAVISYHSPELGNGGTAEDTLYGTMVYSTATNSTGPIVTPGTYNMRPSAQSSLYAVASSTGSSLTLSTSSTQQWVFDHIGNDVYRILAAGNTAAVLDSGSSTGGAGYTVVLNAGGGLGPHQIWKVLSGPSGTVSLVPFVDVVSEIPRTYAFIGTNGGSGTALQTQNGTTATTTTVTTQLWLLQSV